MTASESRSGIRVSESTSDLSMGPVKVNAVELHHCFQQMGPLLLSSAAAPPSTPLIISQAHKVISIMAATRMNSP